MSIIRFNLRENGWVEEAEDGEYVLYSDHLAEVQQNTRLWQQKSEAMEERGYSRGLMSAHDAVAALSNEVWGAAGTEHWISAETHEVLAAIDDLRGNGNEANPV